MVNGSEIRYGDFLNAFISFVTVAVALFFFVVRPLNVLMARRRTEPDVTSTTKDCEHCLSAIPTGASVCAWKWRPNLVVTPFNGKELPMIKYNGPGKNGKVKASFVLPLSETPEPVSVLGDFNRWDPLAHPLKKRANGTRSATVELEPSSRYTFKYLSEGGTWFNDPEADDHDVNEYGETNSVLQT